MTAPPWPLRPPCVPLRPAPRGGPLAAAETKAGGPAVAVARDGVFEGYASLFGVVDLGRDMVMPGAFAASLARRGAAGVRLLWQHDPEQPVGRWLTVEEDGKGLFVRGLLNLRVARARELHALMKEGAVDGLSIGYRTVNARTEPRTGIRKLFKLDLWEVSLVTFPLLPAARVAAVKAVQRPHTLTLVPDDLLTNGALGIKYDLNGSVPWLNQPRVPSGNPEGGQWTNGPVSPFDGSVSEKQPRPARWISVLLQDRCERQIEEYLTICRAIRLRSCYQQAYFRYAACLKFQPIPPLNY